VTASIALLFGIQVHRGPCFAELGSKPSAIALIRIYPAEKLRSGRTFAFWKAAMCQPVALL
jgi:hypothetical protein